VKNARLAIRKKLLSAFRIKGKNGKDKKEENFTEPA